MSNQRNNLSGLIGIAEKAIEAHHLEQTLRAASADLREACKDFRMEQNGGEYVHRDTELHERMRECTAMEFACYQDAKREVRNAQRRLDTAIKAHLNGGKKA